MIWALAGLGDEPRSLVDAGRRTADFYTPTTSSEVPPGCLRKPDGTIVCVTSTLPPSGCVQGPSGMVCKDTPAPPKTDTNAVEPPKEAGTPWFLWAIVGLGVAGMVASAYGDKGFEPNARRRGRKRIIVLVQSKSSQKLDKKKANLQMRRVYGLMKEDLGCTRVSAHSKNRGGHYAWIVEATARSGDIQAIKRELKGMGIPATVVET